MNDGTSRQQLRKTGLVVQLIFVFAFAMAILLVPSHARERMVAQVLKFRAMSDAEITNTIPHQIVPLQRNDDVVSEKDLATVCAAVLPRFDRIRLRPNYVEHALRIWQGQIEFQNERLISGPEMVDYLLDTGRYLASWGQDSNPILKTVDQGVSIRWGQDRSASVHHDHLLACLAEAGVSLDHTVITPQRKTTLQQVYSEALRDFRLNEREVEWSAMAFGSYLAPQQTSSWKTSNGRSISFDRLARRLILGTRDRGVCLGTHRVYSLASLLQYDDAYGGLLSDDTKADIEAFLYETRELILASQQEDGSWPANWHDGVRATAKIDPNQKPYRTVIATGHHLEWLAVAPDRFQLPADRIEKAARWIVDNVQSKEQTYIDANYTYYSHAANALALWRGTSVPEFWVKWRNSHPDCEFLPNFDRQD